MIIDFPPKPAPAAPPSNPNAPGWPPGLRKLVDGITQLGMPCYPLTPSS